MPYPFSRRPSSSATSPRPLKLALRLSLLLGLLGAGTQAFGHRMSECITTLEHRGAVLEISHRLHRHDARRLLAGTVPLTDRDDLEALALRAAFALLVEDRFALRAASGQPLPLTLIGAEVDGDYIYVYQASAAAAPAALEVRHRVLQGAGVTELYQGTGDGKRRLVLEGGEHWQPLSGLESPPAAG